MEDLYLLVISSATAKNPIAHNPYENPGCIGTEFYVSTKELKYVMKKEFFTNICFVQQAEAIF